MKIIKKGVKSVVKEDSELLFSCMLCEATFTLNTEELNALIGIEGDVLGRKKFFDVYYECPFCNTPIKSRIPDYMIKYEDIELNSEDV